MSEQHKTTDLHNVLPQLGTEDWAYTSRGSGINIGPDDDGGSVLLGVDDGDDHAPLISLTPTEARRVAQALIAAADELDPR